jgi:AmmeMemoRadiSam system protein A
MNNTEGHIVIAALMPHAPILVPAVGGKYGHKARASVKAMNEAARRIVQAKPETVVLISPHTPRRRGAFAIWAGPRVCGSLAQFGAPSAAPDLPNDDSFSSVIAREADSRRLNNWQLRDSELDHGATVPLWHLANAGWDGPVTLIGLNYPGEPGVAEMGEAIAAAARQTGRRVAVVASGDMSHRLQPGAPAGFHPRAKEFDCAFIECLRTGNPRQLLHFDHKLQDLAAEDAVDSTVMAVSAADWNTAGHEVLSYEGPFGVGYGVAILFQPHSANISREAASCENDDTTQAGALLLRTARRSIETAFSGASESPDIPTGPFLGGRHAVFVTIRGRGGKLRGCVGTLTPHFKNTVEETWHVSRDAAFHDGRFAPVSTRELEHVRFEVSVLSPMEEITSESELDPRRYGVVVVTSDGCRGVLLPGIKGIDTVEQQLAIARRKGDIEPSEKVRLQRFTVMKFHEQDWSEEDDS